MFTKKGDKAVLDKIAGAPEPYGTLGARLHELIRESAPELEPIVRWGLPFYVRDGVDVCYIKPDKDYLVFGFGETVNPTVTADAHMHPVAWTISSLDESTETEIRRLVAAAAAA